MHSASLKISATRRVPTPGPGDAEPLGELRSASSSAIAPNPSRPARRYHGTADKRPSNRSDRFERFGFGDGPAQGAVFVQVAEHLDADGLVQAAHADRFVAVGADQLSD